MGRSNSVSLSQFKFLLIVVRPVKQWARGTGKWRAAFSSMNISRPLRLAAVCTLISASFAHAEEVGKVDVDWLGNDIVVEAVSDPKVEGVTCHLSYFERGLIDRLQKGNWFEDPSNSSIACRQTGPITIGDIDRGEEGEDVFSERRSIIFKTLRVKRIFDETNQTLIYISHARDVQNGSAKMSMSTVPLFGSGAAE
jgi:CreA protein